MADACNKFTILKNCRCGSGGSSSGLDANYFATPDGTIPTVGTPIYFVNSCQTASAGYYFYTPNYSTITNAINYLCGQTTITIIRLVAVGTQRQVAEIQTCTI
jgi:hypothetical protein